MLLVKDVLHNAIFFKGIYLKKNLDGVLPYFDKGLSKGQIISKCIFGIINSPKKYEKI